MFVGIEADSVSDTLPCIGKHPRVRCSEGKARRIEIKLVVIRRVDPEVAHVSISWRWLCLYTQRRRATAQGEYIDGAARNGAHFWGRCLPPRTNLDHILCPPHTSEAPAGKQHSHHLLFDVIETQTFR